MIRVSFVAASLCLLLAGVAAARPTEVVDARAVQPAPAPVFAISGRGWGHGVGLSQYGALGFARAGWTYDAILAHYYPGTELGAAPVSRVRVLLAEGRKGVKVSSAAAFRVRDGAGGQRELAAGTYAFGPGFTVGGEKLPGPLLFSAGQAPLALDGKAYRGALEATAEKGRLRVVNAVALEAYLAGVVPREVPASWPSEALRAQAVVARSYALASRKTGQPFDLYADTRSQVYGGVAAEQPATTSAVGETAGQVLLYGGGVARTYFYSTSGGRTAPAAEVWGEDVPYLVSVEDPYDALSPHHAWGPFAFGAAKVGKALGVKGRLLDVRTERAPSGRVAEVIVLGTGGETRVKGTVARMKLGLRSTWFTLGALALEPPARRAVPYGATLRLGGVARGLPVVDLEQRPPAGVWRKVASVPLTATGVFSLAVKPTATGEYRLASSAVRTAPVPVRVAAAVKLEPPAAPTALSGVARPALEGAKVALQRQAEGKAWQTVATVALDARGRFTAAVALEPGSYRARFAPGRGYAVGLSRPLVVVTP